MINILIRHSANRKEELKRCIASIQVQLYQSIHLILSADSEEAHQNIIDVVGPTQLSYQVVRVESTGVAFHWNFYCNNLKERVTSGWFFYLDDDDTLVDSYCLKQINTHLIYPYQAVICQFLRKGKPKPEIARAGELKTEHIIRGKIGGSCIFLHTMNKNIAHWDGQRAADFRFIRDVSMKLPMLYVPIPVVRAENNGRKGK